MKESDTEHLICS